MTRKELTILTISTGVRPSLRKCVRSIAPFLDETTQHLIWIGGKDYEAARLYAGILEEEFKWSRHTKVVCGSDTGLYDAINKAIKLVASRFLVFLHDDDYWEDPESVIRELNALSLYTEDTKNSYPGRAQVLFGGAKLGHGLFARRWLSNDDGVVVRFGVPMLPPHTACIFSEEVYSRYTYDPKLSIAADTEVLLRAYADGVIFRRLDCLTVCMSAGGLSTSLPRFVQKISEDLIVYRRNGFSSGTAVFLKMAFKISQYFVGK